MREKVIRARKSGCNRPKRERDRQRERERSTLIWLGVELLRSLCMISPAECC